MNLVLKFELRHRAGLVFGALLLFLAINLLVATPFFVPGMALSVLIIALPHILDFILENKRQKELESRFPEFVRNLTGAIKSGIPASNAVIHIAETDYGSLTPYIKKLANQLEWGIPFHKSFVNFGKETDNKIIKRAIATVIQAEQAGGNLEDVLISITNSLVEIKKIKEERKANIQSQIIQSYIIFFVFLGVMVVIQNVLIPYISDFGLGSSTIGPLGGGEGTSLAQKVAFDFSSPQALSSSIMAYLISLQGVFLSMSLIQGFFAGIVLGKLSEGDLTSGVRHSLVFMTMSFMIMTISQGFL